MNQPPDLQQIEVQAYRTLWEDGLLDLFVGLGILAIAVSWITGFAIYGAIIPALLVPLWQAARKRLVEPRMGYVEFSPDRRRRQHRNLGLLVMLGVLTLILGVAVFLLVRANPSGPSELTQLIVPALPAALLGIGGALVGLLFGIRRFVAYAAMFFVGALVGAGLGAEPGWHFVVPGLVILCVGVSLLAKFLRDYPVAEVEGLT